MLIAEELLLLALDEESGAQLIGADTLRPALGGSLIAELALMERVGVTPRSEGWSRRGRITIISEKPTDDTELDTALAICVAQEGKKVYDLLSEFTSAKKRITADLLPRLLERLAEAGAVAPERSKVLGLFPRTTWPAANPALEDGVRSRLQSALVAGLTPTERTIALIALLNSCSLLTKVVQTEDKKLVRRRAKELSEGNWAAQAVVDAITQVSATTGSMVVMAAAAT